MRRYFKLVVLVSGLALTAGCGAAADSVEDTASETARSRAALGVSGRGPMKVLADAFAEVPLDAGQRTEIESLARAAEGRHAKIFRAKNEALMALADQVDAGVIDRAALHEEAEAILSALKASRAEDRAAVQRLHALLDAEQREELVDAIEDRFFDRLKERRRDGGPRAIAEKLGIDDEQREEIMDAVKSKMRERSEGPGWFDRMRQGRAALASFEDDDFDLDTAMPALDLDARAAAMEEKVVGVAEVVLPRLSPEQRRKAAAFIREQAGADAPF